MEIDENLREKRRFQRHGVAEPQPKPNIHHGDTEKNKGENQVKSKNKIRTRE